MPYSVFTRTWWKENPSYPNGLEPSLGNKSYLKRHVGSKREALNLCKQWNSANEPGRLSRKAEYEEN